MTRPDVWLLDTDIQIHRLGLDTALRAAADAKRVGRAPVAVAAYSMLEFKGNYIADLILLRRKISDSTDVQQAFARIHSSGGRKASLMFLQLVKLLGGTKFNFAGAWGPAQGFLLTHLDAEVASSWAWFRSSVDTLVDDLECTRAAEGPRTEGGHWISSRPDCRKNNTKCRVQELMSDNELRLKALLLALKGAPKLTDELEKIVNVLEATVVKMEYPWEGRTCQGVGDLLIALHAPARQGLVTSNGAEHGLMAGPLGYSVDLLPVGGTRLK